MGIHESIVANMAKPECEAIRHPLSQWRTFTNSVSERYSSLRVQSMTSPVRMAKGDSAKSLCQAACKSCG